MELTRRNAHRNGAGAVGRYNRTVLTVTSEGAAISEPIPCPRCLDHRAAPAAWHR